MKVFINKLKNSNKILLALYLISLITYIVCYVLFTKSLIQLTGIETLLRVIFILLFGVWIFVWLIVGLVSLFTKKYKAYIIMLIFTVIFIGIFGFASYYIDKVYNEISEFSKDTITYTSVLVNKKDNNFDEKSTIGMIKDDKDIEGNVLAKKIIEEHELKNKIVDYTDYYKMLDDLYKGKIDSCFLSNNYGVLFSNEEEYENIEQEIKVVYSYSEQMENQDNVVYTDKKLTEPFTILVLGVDSEKDGLNANQAFNGDTMMMITFNPKTLTASIFSVPRDTYVPIACRNNNYAKINSSAAYGVPCVINTLKNLTGIDVDYYVKINFKGVVDLVNALGGVDVDVEKPYFRFNVGIDWKGQVCEQNSSRQFGNNMVCLDPGFQTLNGEQALAYSRNRHQYIGSDIDRIRHQQDVVAAIADKSKTITSFEQFTELLNVVQKNIDTNMTTEQILSLYSVGKSIILNTLNGNASSFSMYKTYLETYSLPVWTGYSKTSALGYYQSSLDEITQIMRINLELEKAEPNKTFEIDYNEDYETKPYGKGQRSNPQETIMANLIGSDKDYSVNWAKQNGLVANVEYVEEGNEHFNPNYGNDIVVDQSVVIGALINNVNSVTLYVNRIKDKPIITPTPTPIEPQQEQFEQKQELELEQKQEQKQEEQSQQSIIPENEEVIENNE